jgi:hypothetical protein
MVVVMAMVVTGSVSLQLFMPEATMRQTFRLACCHLSPLFFQAPNIATPTPHFVHLLSPCYPYIGGVVLMSFGNYGRSII